MPRCWVSSWRSRRRSEFSWRRGLSERVGRARGFYAVLVASTGLALAVSVAGISVNGMLVTASVIGGFGTPDGPGAPSPPGPRFPGHRASDHFRKLAIAGWAVAVIVGGFGLLAVIGAAAGTF